MKIADILKEIRVICIETAPFIYYVERYPLYVDKMRAIFRPMDQGRIEVITSTVTLTEVLTKPIKSSDTALVNAYRDMLQNTINLKLMPVDAAVAERAAELRAQYNLRTPDALQVALAVQSRCDAFLSNDNGLKRIREIPVLLLDELEVD